MNILLWVLQILLALHTIMGAVWKFSNSEQTVDALNSIPHGLWLALIVLELACSLALVIPALARRMGILIPIAALCIAAEMLLFSGLQIFSGKLNYGQIVYWLVVALLCAFIAYGRIVIKPVRHA